MEIEHRILTKSELDRLIVEAEPSETKFLRDLNLDIFDFFKNNSLIQDGLVIDGRPIYIIALMKDENGRNNLWTVVNKDTGYIIQLTKYVKQGLNDWIKNFGDLYATMEKVSPKSMKWVEWLGFKIIEENDMYVTYRIGV
jgi:hypothetical protein